MSVISCVCHLRNKEYDDDNNDDDDEQHGVKLQQTATLKEVMNFVYVYPPL